MVARLFFAPMLALAALGSAPAVAQTTPVPAPAPAWTSFTPLEGHFSVLLPGEPKRQESITPDGPGKDAKNVIYFSVAPPSIYMIAFSEYPAGLTIDNTGEINANRDNFLKGMGATLTSSTAHTTGSYTGIEFTGTKAQGVDPNSGQTQPALYIRGRVYMQGRRPLMTAVVTNPANAGAAENTRFLDSFKPR